MGLKKTAGPPPEMVTRHHTQWPTRNCDRALLARPWSPHLTPCLACLTFTVNSPRLWFCWGGVPYSLPNLKVTSLRPWFYWGLSAAPCSF